MEQVLFIAVIALALILAFVNGFHDGFNVIANSILSRSMASPKALFLACGATFIGSVLFGTAVATTIGSEIINPISLTRTEPVCAALFILSGLISTIIWSLLTWWVGMPPSSSHALIGGMVGGALAAFGCGIVNWDKLLVKVVLVLFLSPLIGMVIAYGAMSLSIFSFKGAHRKMNDFFRRNQWISLLILAAGHGTNNAQKAMGLITLVLMISGSPGSFAVPLWVVLGCAGALTLGVSAGGWKFAGILGSRTFRIQSGHAFNAQFTAGAVILAAAFLGGPVSTTQIVKFNVVGVGAGSRKRPVRRMLVRDFMIAWLITIPASAFLAAVIYWIASGVLGYGMGSFEVIMGLLGQ